MTLIRRVDEFSSQQAYIVSTLQDLRCRLDVPLIRDLLGDSFSPDSLSESGSDSEKSYSDDSSPRPAPSMSGRRVTLIDKEVVVRRQTVVTEVVGQIAQHMYDMPLQVIRLDGQDNREDVADDNESTDGGEIDDEDPRSIKFLWRPVTEAQSDEAILQYYEKVNIDGIIYSVRHHERTHRSNSSPSL
jgi:hypothetical protein